jgi:hypothetical protein
MDVVTDLLCFAIAAGNLTYGLAAGRVFNGVNFFGRLENDYGYWLFVAFWGIGSLAFLATLIAHGLGLHVQFFPLEID